MSGNPEIPKRNRSELPFLFSLGNTFGEWLNRIGWKQIWKGHLSLKFVEHHGIYTTLNGLENNSEQWVTSVILHV